MPPRSKNVNWFETWNRRSRLRSGTLMLRSLNISSEEPAVSSTKQPVVQIDLSEEECQNHLRQDHEENGKESENLENVSQVPEGKDTRCRDLDNVGHGLEGNHIDEDYKLFLDHLRIDGKSYVCEMIVDGSPLAVKYEEEDDSSEVIQTQPKRSRGSTPSEARVQSGRKKSKGGSLSPNSSDIVDTPSPPVSQDDVECPLLDEGYQIFLSHVRACNGSMILEMDNGVVVKYEEERGEEEVEVEEVIINSEEKNNGLQESGKEVVVKCEPIEDEGVEDRVEELPAKAEILIEEVNVYSCSLQLQPSTGFSDSLAWEVDYSMESLTFKISAPFKDRLMAVLQKPYDQNEYDELLKVATNHGPKIKYKHLRHDSIPYTTNELGRSYLDYYPDLAKQIEGADCPMALMLLRGFFFWLKNLGHEGAYKPWTSASIGYEALPSDGLESVVPLQIKMPKDSLFCRDLLSV